MNAVEVVLKVLNSGLLTPELTAVPVRGAWPEEIRAEEQAIGRAFRPDHVQFLRRWNGIDLEIIRLFGCGNQAGHVGRLAEHQAGFASRKRQATVIGSDAAGFVYCQAPTGEICSIDSDGGNEEVIAANVDDLFDRVIFGCDATKFGGEDWVAELRRHGVLT